MSDAVIHRSGDRILFRCPGCGSAHGVDGSWQFNGDTTKPTIRPSILTNHIPGSAGPRCHSFVTDGRIEFLADSTHALAGKTVDLPAWDAEAPKP